MEIQTFGGLPAHPLFVHLPVVLVPLATIGALLMCIKPSWRRIYGIPTAVLAVIAAITTQLAIGTGEALEEMVPESRLVETHSQIAEQARPFIFLFALAVLAAVVVDFLARRRAAAEAPAAGAADAPGGGAGGDTLTVTRTRPATVRSGLATAALALSVVGFLLGGVSTVQVYRTGHSGAKATWHDVKKESGGSGGESGGEGGEGGG
ncbi:MAG: DUF2231 domain-containing protein [Microthrixaceae bacterium]